MRFSFVGIMVLVIGLGAVAQPIPPTNVPTDPELKNLQWNRYKLANFTILSIDDSQGKWLFSNMDAMKKWCISRWGFPDVTFAHECRVMCVPNRKLMKKLFNLSGPSYEVRRKDGKIEITAMWLILDDKPANVIPSQLSHVCFAEFESVNNTKLGWYAKRGMSLLNGTAQEIRQKFSALGNAVNRNVPLIMSDKMFTLTEEDYYKMKPEDQLIFDYQAMALCLLLRKEFGEAKMQGFMRLSASNLPETVLRSVYRFRDFKHFDSSYLRYMRDLTKDVTSGKTPDSYLEVRPVRR